MQCFPVVLLLLLAVKYICCNRYYYVKPEPCLSLQCRCPQINQNIVCETLKHFIINQDIYFLSNTVFYFLEGVHTVKSNIQQPTLFIKGVSNISLIGLGKMEQAGFYNTVMQSSAIIECSTSQVLGIVIFNSSNIFLSSITMNNCGRKNFHLKENNWFYQQYTEAADSSSLDQSELQRIKVLALSLNASIALVEVQNVTVEKVSIQNSHGCGILAVNAFNITVSSSSIVHSNIYDAKIGCNTLNTFLRYAANLAIYYFNPITCPEHPAIHYLRILSTNISFGINLCLGVADEFNGGGLRIIMEQSGNIYGIDTTIDKSIFYGNTALYGSNVFIKISPSVVYYRITMVNSIVSEGNPNNPFKEIDRSIPSAMSIFHGILNLSNKSYCIFSGDNQLQYAYNPIVLKHNFFSHNNGNAIDFTFFIFENYYIQEIVISSTKILANNGKGIFVIASLSNAPISFHIHELTVGTSTGIWIIGIQNVTLVDSMFYDNINSSIALTDSKLYLKGRHVFRNNSAIRGGAIYLLSNSFIMLLTPYDLVFVNNHAREAGGGIFVGSIGEAPICFLQVIVTHKSIIDKTAKQGSISFVNNTAGITGTVVYGGYIDNCQVIPLSWPPYNFYNPFISQLTEYNLKHGDSTYTAVSSDAGRVCFCEEKKPKCNLYTITQQCYPGDEVSFMIVAAGQVHGASIGPIQALEFVNDKFVTSVLKYWNTPMCNLFNYTINVNSLNDSVQLLLSISFGYRRYAPRYLDVNITVVVDILDCPPGFGLSLTSKQCDCDQFLLRIDKSTACYIKNNTVSRSGNLWLGYNANTSCLVAHRNCPFDYCKLNQIDFTITQPEKQCAFNRSGLLCGQCSEGLSVILGSNQCAKCSNDFIFLFLPFSIIGILLVVVLLKLNLTVSVGSFNGLIFFANIVKLNDFVFFPNGPIPFVSQFISWINLDLGIETCLFNGMSNYIKVWLQFAFPFYIWIIIGAIVLLSRYTRLHKLIGSNAIQVLATLILLSFTKLLSTVTLSLSSISLSCKGSPPEKRWYVNPNVIYFSRQLAPLLVAALSIVVIFITPYTLGLLLCQVIEKILSHRVFQCFGRHWLKIKPFFDAYGGPFREQYQFWTGLLLVSRISLLSVILFSTTPSTAISAITTTMGILFSIMVMLKGVYKTWYHNALECCYMLTLILMCGMVVSGYGNVGAILGVSIAFGLFSIAFFHNLIVTVRKANCCNRCNKRKSSFSDLTLLEIDSDITALDSEDTEVKAISSTTVIIHEREPLIYDDDDDEFLLQ